MLHVFSNCTLNWYCYLFFHQKRWPLQKKSHRNPPIFGQMENAIIVFLYTFKKAWATRYLPEQTPLARPLPTKAMVWKHQSDQHRKKCPLLRKMLVFFALKNRLFLITLEHIRTITYTYTGCICVCMFSIISPLDFYVLDSMLSFLLKCYMPFFQRPSYKKALSCNDKKRLQLQTHLKHFILQIAHSN